MSKRLLVVDDHADTVRSAVEFFRALGYDVKGCSNGKEAIQLVGEFDPDAVIMDLSMPQVSGWEAARTIRKSSPGKRPLLIALTGECKGALDLILSKMNGFDHYYLKPTEPAKLLELIEKGIS